MTEQTYQNIIRFMGEHGSIFPPQGTEPIVKSSDPTFDHQFAHWAAMARAQFEAMSPLQRRYISPFENVRLPFPTHTAPFDVKYTLGQQPSAFA